MQKIRGDRLSMVYQDPMTSLNPLMRIGDAGRGGAEPRTASRGEARDRSSLALLASVELPDPGKRLGRIPHSCRAGSASAS